MATGKTVLLVMNYALIVLLYAGRGGDGDELYLWLSLSKRVTGVVLLLYAPGFQINIYTFPPMLMHTDPFVKINNKKPDLFTGLHVCNLRHTINPRSQGFAV